MADVRPFRGLRYNPSVAGELTGLLCPPYDIISPAQQAELYRQNPYNAVRLELAESLPEDTAEDNRYTRAAATFQGWLKDGVLLPERSAAMYLVEEEYTFSGRAIVRRGLMACMRLEEFGKGSVYPHEFTTEGPKQDRLELMKACAANFSPILSLYPDQDGSIGSLLARVKDSPPDASTGLNGEAAYSVWVIRDRTLLSEIRDAMRPRPIYLADGHHRYETALGYRDLLRESRDMPSDNAAANFVMMSLASMDDPGVLVLPYHRLLGGLSEQEADSLWTWIEEMFHIEELPLPSSSPGDIAETLEGKLKDSDKSTMTMGVFSSQLGRAAVLSLKTSQAPDPGTSVLERCEPRFLSDRVLRPTLGEVRESKAVTFVHDAVEAIAGVQRGEYQMALLLRPVPMDLFEEVVSKGERLPSKSTYFYPKLPTGLVFNHLVGELES